MFIIHIRYPREGFRRLAFALPLALAAIMVTGPACRRPTSPKPAVAAPAPETLRARPDTLPVPRSVIIAVVPRDIRVKDYFRFVDGLVQSYDSLLPYALTEHLLVRANPWIIDTLENTDYYRRKEQGKIVYDQRQLLVLHRGDTLIIPDSLMARELQNRIEKTWLDINIPEYRLRVVEGTDTLYSMLVRVGQHKKRYQEAIKRAADLRTMPGKGQIIRINRAPTLFEDPHTGRRLTYTKRDDGRSTRMPIIPWLEPEINGRRLGQMIHPTTNPETLGRAYSNGCIGCSEADAWRLYYFAPVGTKVSIRYDLKVVGPDGYLQELPDIYGWGQQE